MISNRILLWGLVVFLLACENRDQEQKPSTDLLNWVNPYIGTTMSRVPSVQMHQELANEDKGQTFPAVGFPYALTNWTPQTRATETKCIAPYYYHDSTWQGIRASHWMSGSCTQDYGSFTIMPMVGDLILDPEKRAVPFQHQDEKVTPAYYALNLPQVGIRVEVTGKTRAGIMRFSREEAGEMYLILEPNSDEGQGYVRIDPEKQEIIGYNPVHRIYQGWGQSAGFSGHFVVQFDQQFLEFGCWKGDHLMPEMLESRGNGAPVGAFIKVKVPDGQPVKIRCGTSFTSLEHARANLKAEIEHWDFDQVKSETEQEWEKTLSQIVVEGSDQDKEMFYSALYHAKLLPRIFSDQDGSYTGFGQDSSLYQAQGNYYVDFTTWDSYRAVHPLMTIIDPERTRDIVRSVIQKAEQGGWLPIFPCWNNYTAGMIGDHLVSVIGDAYLKGIEDFDLAKAYRYMRQNAFSSPTSWEEYTDGKGRRALDSYLKYGYIPLEDSVKEAFHKQEQVSRTLEYAYDDYVLSQVARKMKHEDDHQTLLKRAQNYQHVFDTTTGFVRGRYADGSWIEPFDPYQKERFITEGSSFQYTWYVPQDVAGLIRLMGGKEKFNQKLDMFFEQGEYWHGNEPSHQIVYMYAWSGAPWKTQQRVRDIIYQEYSTGPGGLSGNDDVGQMSAWLVFSMAGIYPVTPGMPVYVLGSPVFDQVTFNLSGGKSFKIRAGNNSSDNKYIQSAQLNGQPLNRAYLWHHEIVNGGELELIMGPEPEKSWAVAAENLPPSLDFNLDEIN
ncbi:MAG: GH92 family glycosyl hydrolase [Candidatus Cyclobacteriaceae bacterium M3_2C_046]